jgi:hypothetical protein
MLIHDRLNAASRRRRGDHCVNDHSAMSVSDLQPDSREQPRRAQTVFDILNVSGKLARGIEIELCGVGTEDVFHAFYLNRYGAPGVSRTADTIRLRFESLWLSGAQTLSLNRQVHAVVALSRPYVWEIALLGAGGSERLCLEMSTQEVVATYRWLVAADDSGSTLVAADSPAFIHDARTHTARPLSMELDRLA